MNNYADFSDVALRTPDVINTPDPATLAVLKGNPDNPLEIELRGYELARRSLSGESWLVVFKYRGTERERLHALSDAKYLTERGHGEYAVRPLVSLTPPAAPQEEVSE